MSFASATPHEVRDKQAIQTSNIRLETFFKMMLMSDVGVFEFHPSAILLHANESWYKLSGHPRDLEAHKRFSFVELVYPDDTELVMAQWSKLTSGIPCTFEMRWKATKPGKPTDGPDADAQWIVAACVPVTDENGQLMSIAGITIDISAQKRATFEAGQRAEALERARTSEHRFASFAKLAPVAIYIFDQTKGMQYCSKSYHNYHRSRARTLVWYFVRSAYVLIR